MFDNYPTRNVKILTFRNGFLDIAFLDSPKCHIHLPIFLYHESVLKGGEPNDKKGGIFSTSEMS
jgi:hypothetical protein